MDLEILELLSTTMSHESGSSLGAGVSLRARMNMVESSINLGYLNNDAKKNMWILVKMRTLKDIVRPSADEFGKQKLELFIQGCTLNLCNCIFCDSNTLVKLIYGSGVFG